MKVKYSDEATPLRNKHSGYTFIPSGYGNPVLSGQKSGRYRYVLQHLRMQCNQKAITNWRNMSEDVKSAWSAFASDFPQPSKKDPNVFLTGYQLFIKRNTYEFLHEGINAPFVEFPELISLPNPTFSASIGIDGMCLDVTEWYSRNFGILPNVGDYLLCRILPMAEFSGQFFAPYVATLEVTEVFIDGVFLTLNFTGSAPGIVFSVYLSRPVRAGRSYTDTKYRYMGCFKPTQFVQLTDTPEDYTGESGKFVAVKSDESGLEFVEAGGGGLDCSDLEDCSIIETMVSSIIQISEGLVPTLDVSIPAVGFGQLFNFYAAKSSLLPSGNDWRVAEWSDWSDLDSYLDAEGYNGNDLKESGLVYWNANLGLNTFKFFGRGAGLRYNTGSFYGFRLYNYMWSFDNPFNAARAYCYYLPYNSSVFAYQSFSTQWNRAASIRLCRDAVGVSNNTIGFYTGNNGRVYRTVVINEIEWLADNLAETMLNDGSEIPYISDATEFAAATTPAWCAPAGSLSNV